MAEAVSLLEAVAGAFYTDSEGGGSTTGSDSSQGPDPVDTPPHSTMLRRLHLFTARWKAERLDAGAVDSQAYRLTYALPYGPALVAEKKFEAGEKVLSEYALLRGPYDLEEEDALGPDWQTAAMEEVGEMSMGQKKQLVDIMALNTYDHEGVISVRHLSVMLNVWYSDRKAREKLGRQLAVTFEQHSTRMPGADCRALSPDFVFCKHCCNPNIAMWWNPRTGQMHVYALRPIEKGEEIYHCSIDPYQIRAARFEDLLEICSCWVCRLNGPELDESQRRRSELGEDYLLLKRWKRKYFGTHSPLDDSGNKPVPTKGARKMFLKDPGTTAARLAASRILKNAADEDLVHWNSALAHEVLYTIHGSLANETDDEHLDRGSEHSYLTDESDTNEQQEMHATKAADHRLKEMQCLLSALGWDHVVTLACLRSLTGGSTEVEALETAVQNLKVASGLQQARGRFIPKASASSGHHTAMTATRGPLEQHDSSFVSDLLIMKHRTPGTLAPRLDDQQPSDRLPTNALDSASPPPTMQQHRLYDVDDSEVDNEAGIIATENVRAGQLIIRERVLLERPDKLLDKELRPTPAFHKFFNDIRSLNLEDKEQLLAMWAAMSGASKRILAISDAKEGLEVPDNVSVEQLDEMLKEEMHRHHPAAIRLGIIFLVAAFPFSGSVEVHRLFSGPVHFLNHSCAPNAEAIWDPKARCLIVRAIKAIYEGEEVLISYLDPCLPKAIRDDALHFTCKCSECDKHGKEKSRSESRRMTMMNGLSIIKDFKTKHLRSQDDFITNLGYELSGSILADRDHPLILETALACIRAAKKNGLKHSNLVAAYDTAFIITFALAILGPITENPQNTADCFYYKMCAVELLLASHGQEHERTKKNRAALGSLLAPDDRSGRKAAAGALFARYATFQ